MFDSTKKKFNQNYRDSVNDPLSGVFGGFEDFNDLLGQILGHNLNMWTNPTSDSEVDAQKDAYNQFIDWIHELGNRQYNEQLRDNQRAFDTDWRDNERAYNSPQELLRRLMATGMSRDAALQMLNGVAGGAGTGAGVGAAPFQSASGLSSSVLAPSQANAAQFQNAVALADTFISLGNLAINAMELGYNAPAMLANGQIMQNQADMQRAAYQSQQNLGALVGAYDQAKRNGVQFSGDYSSPDEFLKELQSADPNLSPDLQKYLQSGGLDALMSSPHGASLFNAWYRDNIDTKNHELRYAEIAQSIRESQARVGLTNENIRLCGQQIKNLSAEEKAVLQNTLNGIALTDAQVRNYNADTSLKGAQRSQAEASTELTRSQALNQDMMNTILKPEANAVLNVEEDLTRYKVDKLMAEIQMWRDTAGNKKVMQQLVDNYLKDVDNQRTLLAYLGYEYAWKLDYVGGGDQLTVDQQNKVDSADPMWSISNWLNQTFVGDAISLGLQTAGSIYNVSHFYKH